MTGAKSNYKKKIQDLISHVCLQRCLKIESAYWVVVGILLLCGIFKRICIPQVPFTGPDSIGYLGVALRQIMTGEFHCIAERSWPYPGFLSILLNIKSSYTIISTSQHLIGALSVSLFAIIWWNIREMFTYSYKAEKNVFFFLGLLGCFFFSQENAFIFIEHWSHPESITAPLGLLAIFGFVYLIKQQKTEKKIIFGIIYIQYLFFLTKFQPRTTLSLIPCMLATLYFLFRNQRLLFFSAITFLLSALFIYCFQILPFKRFCKKDQTRHTRSMTIFAGNMKAISEVLKSEKSNSKNTLETSETFSLTQYEKAKNNGTVKAIGLGWHESLGYNACVFGDPSFYMTILSKEGGTRGAIKFYEKYILLSILRKPELWFKKITSQFYYGVFKQNIIAQTGKINGSWGYTADTLKTWPNELHGEFTSKYIIASEELRNLNFLLHENTKTLRRLFNFLYSYATYPFFILFLLQIVFDKKTNNFDSVIIFIFTFIFFSFLTIAIVLSMDTQRYIMDLAPFFILLFLAGSFVVFQKILILKRFVLRKSNIKVV